MTDSSRDSPVDTTDEQTDDEWRFGVDEVGDDVTDAVDGVDFTPGEQRELPPIEPGNPSLENAFFVLLGVLGTVLVFLSV